MNEQSIRDTIDVIGALILNYELADKEIKNLIKRNSYKDMHSKNIIFGLKILSIATGTVYTWSRQELEDGTLFSGICQVVDEQRIEVSPNYAK